jgi:hypothetical protein
LAAALPCHERRQHAADGYAAPAALLQPGMEHVLAGYNA